MGALVDLTPGFLIVLFVCFSFFYTSLDDDRGMPRVSCLLHEDCIEETAAFA